MKVIFVNSLQEGGAAKAAMRLLKGVQEKKADARLIVQRKTDGDPSVVGPQTGRERVMSSISPVFEWLCVGLYALRRGCMFSPALMPDRLPSRTAQFDPDIVHLHWITNGFMRVEAISRFNRPVVWTLHDSWAFTGGCHIPFDCYRYQETCGKCPILFSSLNLDLSRWLWHRKQRAWRGVNLTIVAPSRWMKKCAETSSLFRDKRIEVIPNCLDLELYKPVDKRIARAHLSLPQDKKLILFGGKNCTEDPNKGFPVLAEALRGLAGRGWRNRAELIVSGSTTPSQLQDFGMNARYLGWLSDDSKIALLNSAADICVVPSMQESLSYAAMEAMACGTPCVAFDQGGLPDVIDHLQTGYLARPYSPDNLAEGIDWVLNNEDHGNLSLRARKKVEREFSVDAVAGLYMKLYEEIAGNAG